MPNDPLRDIALITEAFKQAASTFSKIIEAKRKRDESILNNEPIEEQPCMFDEEKINQRLKELRELEVTCKPQTCYVNGIEYVPRPLDFQPLTGEFITKEECERREEAAWDFAREKFVVDKNPFNKQYRFLSFEQYKSYKRNQLNK